MPNAEGEVAVSDHDAVLTFNFVSWPERPMCRWNATEAYRKDAGQWRLIHQHWPLTKP